MTSNKRTSKLSKQGDKEIYSGNGAIGDDQFMADGLLYNAPINEAADMELDLFD
ncbi:MAG: hypothetical protein H6Q19_1486 [Bacteroidetes bacterium]|nr:hypothetical protein [Bacteroidota bacterium]